MKTDIREVVTRTSNPNRATVKMSIDPENIAHILRIATNLYADPASACIREYSANAMDSHIAAGQTRPIEVTLPTYDKPTLVVQDFGIGMSVDDITTIYSKYGASTKRDSDDFIGAFGLGCKAALSMTPSFVLTSIKDNIKVVAIIHRGDDGVGSIEFVTELPTTEGNGVTISIPVTDKINEYAKKARSIFVTWNKGTVLIDGQVPALSVTDEADFLPLGEIAYLSRINKTNAYSYNSTGSMVVNMGGIGYNVDREQVASLLNSIRATDVNSISGNVLDQVKHALSYSMTVVVNVPVGSVTLVPSRESVQWTNKSTKVVRERLIAAIDSIPAALAADFDDCNSYVEVLSKEIGAFASSFRGIYSHVKWQGQELPKDLKFYYAHTDNYADQGVETYTISYVNGDRVPMRKTSYGRAFSFGFEANDARSFDLTGKGTNVGQQYVFVKVEDSEEYRKKIAGYFNSYLANQRDVLGKSFSSTVVVGYTNDLFSNPWLKAVFEAKTNEVTMVELTVDEIVDTAKEYRKSQRNYVSTASGQPIVRTAVHYETWTVDSKGKKNYASITATEVNEMAEENGYTVYLDNMKFTDDSYNYNWGSISHFVPKNSIVVSVGKGRKFEALEKRIDAIPGDLEKALNTEFNDYFANVKSTDYYRTSRSDFLKRLNHVKPHLKLVNDSLLKSLLVDTPVSAATADKTASALQLVNSHLLTLDSKQEKWKDKFEDAAKEIADSFPMIWHVTRSYSCDTEVYTKAFIDYLNMNLVAIDAMLEKIDK